MSGGGYGGISPASFFIRYLYFRNLSSGLKRGGCGTTTGPPHTGHLSFLKVYLLHLGHFLIIHCEARHPQATLVQPYPLETELHIEL